MVCDVVAMFYLQGDRGLSLIFNRFFHRSLLRAQRVEDRNQNLAMMRIVLLNNDDDAADGDDDEDD